MTLTRSLVPAKREQEIGGLPFCYHVTVFGAQTALDGRPPVLIETGADGCWSLRCARESPREGGLEAGMHYRPCVD